MSDQLKAEQEWDRIVERAQQSGDWTEADIWRQHRAFGRANPKTGATTNEIEAAVTQLDRITAFGDMVSPELTKLAIREVSNRLRILLIVHPEEVTVLRSDVAAAVDELDKVMNLNESELSPRARTMVHNARAMVLERLTAVLGEPS